VYPRPPPPCCLPAGRSSWPRRHPPPRAAVRRRWHRHQQHLGEQWVWRTCLGRLGQQPHHRPA